MSPAYFTESDRKRMTRTVFERKTTPQSELLANPTQVVDVLDEIAAERQRQDAKWGEQNHPDGTGATVQWTPIAAPADEVVEDVRHICDRRHRAGRGTWLDILLEEFAEAAAEADPVKLRAELVQVAAVAVAWVEAIDRRGGAS